MRMAVRHFRSLCKPLELEPHSRLGERLERRSVMVRLLLVHVFPFPKIGSHTRDENQSTTRQLCGLDFAGREVRKIGRCRRTVAGSRR
jgi:hypothetical protein